MKMREKYAVNLRKKKAKDVIAAKRMRKYDNINGY
jgi:hypothetical protein